ncbi:ROK family transcriptional regulator [Vibrio sp. La 4.2.2]|uniref:ROK family transcriptional regulator n=1 Tax=Vibrio sp. La 4.2.2 TaxID=2998830 RepID=UPI0022CDCFF5|nr:ROK family transcriptional regulator [Vibrio sp. La 4.2.2]MDA0110067.1 ROK family transcriptional regulator [Vibrio sp. La 4.2.2]
MIKGMNNKSVRSFNSKQVMRLLFQHRKLSKSQLATKLELSIPALTKILNYLIDLELVEHINVVHSGRGNATGMYQMTQNTTPILCLHITPYRISTTVLNGLMDPIVDYRSLEINPTHPSELVASVFAIYRQCIKETGSSRFKVAMALHGQVDRRAGTSVLMPQARWAEPIDFKYLLEEEFGAEVQVDNDCVMLALAEKWLTKDHPRDFCVINVDYGIGSSFLVNDKIFRGELFGSGQIGHSIIDQDGRKCCCGRYGCLETIASTKAITSEVRKMHKTNHNHSGEPSQISFEDVATLYHSGDMVTKQTIQKAAGSFGISLYNFLVTLSVNDIVIYGDIRRLGHEWLDIVKSKALFNPFEANTNALKEQRASVRYGELPDSRLLNGIGFLYIEALIDNF